MPHVKTMDAAAGLTGQAASLKDWLSLTKPEITFLVAISALAGFFLASPNAIDGWALLWALIGITMASAGGCALNHFLERDLDGHMKRTANRPLPSGRISPRAAMWFGILLVSAGVGILCPLTNPLTGVLAAGTVLLYLFVYTPMKRLTTLNTVVGTIPGALPALGGWTAASGGFGVGGWVLFGVLLCWQMPHFFSLAWMYRKDYARAGYAMTTVKDTHGTSTSIQMLVWTTGMILFSLAPVWLGLLGLWYGAAALVLGLWFMLRVIRFHRTKTSEDARRVLKVSVYYIPLLLAIIVLDRFVSS